jgi:hypothetical protein
VDLDRFRTNRIRRFERNGKRFVERDGVIIEMAVENDAAPAPKTRNKANDFARVPLDLAAGLAKATGTSSAVVWVLLIYLAWKTKSSTFTLSNEILKRYGVNRNAKYRVLARLEKAGFIQVERRGFRAPLITLLDQRPSK